MNIEQPYELENYLLKRGVITPRDNLQTEVLRGGVSNRTVLLRENGRARWVFKQALTKLRVREDWFSDPARIEHEALGIYHLSKILPKGQVPELVFTDPDHYLLCMTAVPEPHFNFKTLLLNGQVNLEYFDQFGRVLGTIHSQGTKSSSGYQQIFPDTTFFETLRLEPYYAFCANRMPDTKPFFQQLIDDCRADRFTLVHGDYSPKNILFHEHQIVLLDHEVIHFGDGTFDLGFALSHLLSKANHLSHCRDQLYDATLTLWRSYQSNGPALSHKRLQRVVHHTLACLLARVSGRSPLEYLSDTERKRQTALSKQFLEQIPRSVPHFIDSFYAGLSHH